MTKKMAIVFIILGSLLLITGLIIALKSIKPMYFNVISGIIILIGTFFGLFGKQLQDKSSSDKSDKILKSSESTEQKVGELKGQNIELTKRSEELKVKAEQQAKMIDNLRNENNELSKRLFDKATTIYDLNKTIKFPLPSDINITYNLIFQFEDKVQGKVDTLLKKKYDFQEGLYSAIDSSIIAKYLNWDQTYNWDTLFFLKEYKKDRPNPLIIGFTTINNSVEKPIKRTRLSYNITNKSFMIVVENELLQRDNNVQTSLQNNLAETSLLDLANSTVLFSPMFPDHFANVKISNLKISSKELNLDFRSLKSENNKDFYQVVELKL